MSDRNPELTNTSKFLSLVLRHQPELIGIALDKNGWVDINVLLEAANQFGREISRALLDEVVFANEKQRFAFSPDGLRIRANQGHSIAGVDLALAPSEPPVRLFHGTVAKFLDSIHANGLQKMQRQHVHLSATTETAVIVAKRRGTPTVIEVRALAMFEAGFDFYLAANGVWLTNHVPQAYLQMPPSAE